jgi:nucleoid-associated protein YgaU
MGVFDFIKGVGEKLGIGGKDDEPDAEALKKAVEEHGLEAEGLQVEVDGDTVKVAGAAPNNSIREKIILTMGNVLGVGKVEEDISVAEADGDATFYTVEKGDTLWKISSDHYGNGAKYESHLRGKPPDADPSGQDLSRSGAAHSAA